MARRSNGLKSTCLVILVTVLSISCGKGSGGSGSGDEGTNDSNWLAGSWLGTYGNKGEGMGLLDPAEVRADFSADGSFKIVLTETPAASTSGTWDDYPGETLILSLKESTISRLGAPNTTHQFHYERRGEKLTIYNDKAILLVKKANTDGKGDDAVAQTKPLIGLWKCTDPSANKWALDIKSETEFWGTITRGDAMDLVIKGSIAVGTDAKKELRFTVSDSNNKTVQGSEFLGHLSDDQILNLAILSKTSDGTVTQGSQFSCRK